MQVSERTKLGQSARRRIRQLFSIERMIDETGTILRLWSKEQPVRYDAQHGNDTHQVE